MVRQNPQLRPLIAATLEQLAAVGSQPPSFDPVQRANERAKAAQSQKDR